VIDGVIDKLPLHIPDLIPCQIHGPDQQRYPVGRRFGSTSEHLVRKDAAVATHGLVRIG
jgi:hypothetical protein